MSKVREVMLEQNIRTLATNHRRPSAMSSASSKLPFVVGIGGTARDGSTSGKALETSLAAAAARGATTMLITGEQLNVPMYNPGETRRSEAASRLVDALRRCDGLIIASPAYHGTISGLVKNALDYAEDLRGASRTYLDGVPVGCIACGAGQQAAVQTLAVLRTIAHSLRGWPTPLGVCLNSSTPLFDDLGDWADRAAQAQLETVGQQVVDFAAMRQATAAAPVVCQ